MRMQSLEELECANLNYVSIVYARIILLVIVEYKTSATSVPGDTIPHYVSPGLGIGNLQHLLLAIKFLILVMIIQ